MTRYSSRLKAALAGLALVAPATPVPAAAPIALSAALGGLALAGAPGGAAAEPASGPYLAARAAAQRNDYDAAARYFAQALAVDPSAPALRDQALTFKLLTGDLDGAASLASALIEAAPGHRLAGLSLVASDIAKGRFGEAQARLDDAQSGVNPLVSRLLSGWTAMGRGDAEAMEAAFDALGGDGMSAVFADYHRGLARAAMGDLSGAREALERALEAGGSRDGRPAMALAAVLERLGDLEAARRVYDQAAATPQGERAADAARKRMERGETSALPVRSASSGAAEALFSIAAALSADRNATVALLYARTALALRPELNDARLLIGGLLAEQGDHEGAAAVFQKVPRSSPLFVAAEMGRADSLAELDREDQAILVLSALARDYPEALDVQLAHAGALRRAERWEAAAEAYDAAIALIDPVEPRHWSVFYQRGIAHERADAWPKAEADFLRALELEPEQPLVQNYLGYSWVEKGENLERAQALIESAVEQRPEDGYITDSLGWVLYRVGDYAAAVPHLERAVELMPTDPIINDHLGDALWKVGRRREAAFQWRRALSFDPEAEEAERIRRKLEVGLDAVLKAEDEEAAARAPAASARNETLDGG